MIHECEAATNIPPFLWRNLRQYHKYLLVLTFYVLYHTE
jgi:hypothetical protein